MPINRQTRRDRGFSFPSHTFTHRETPVRARPSRPSTWYGQAHLLIPLLITIFLLALSSPALAASHAHEDSNGQISGQLLDGTNANAPLPGQSVTLQMAQNGNSQDLKTITTDAQGSFTFSGLSTDKTISYVLFLRYQGAQYLSDVLTLNNTPTQKVNLTVYDATQSTDNIAIATATVLFQEPNIQQDIITVSEAFSFDNLSTHAYVGTLDVANKSKPNALLFSLPAGAKNVNLQKGFTGYNVVQVDHGFATDAALLPGTKNEFAFSFDVPYTSSTYDFTYQTFLPTAALSFFVPPDIHASSHVLTPQGVVNTGAQHPYNLLNGTLLPAQKNVDLHLEGLLTQLPSDSATSFNPLLIWLLLAIIVVLATLGIVRFVTNSRRPRKSKRANAKKPSTNQPQKKGAIATQKANQSKASTPKEREQALLDALLRLDQEYEAGKISKEIYKQRRSRTKARLRSILSEKESSVH